MQALGSSPLLGNTESRGKIERKGLIGLVLCKSSYVLVLFRSQYSEICCFASSGCRHHFLVLNHLYLVSFCFF